MRILSDPIQTIHDTFCTTFRREGLQLPAAKLENRCFSCSVDTGVRTYNLKTMKFRGNICPSKLKEW